MARPHLRRLVAATALLAVAGATPVLGSVSTPAVADDGSAGYDRG